MHHTASRFWFSWVGICLALVWLLPVPLWGAALRPPATKEIMHEVDFVLSQQGDCFSLRAHQQAPLRDLVETLDNLLAIEVIVRIPPDHKAMLDFVGLSLKEAFQRLKMFANIVIFSWMIREGASP